jgi:hypothetical protein
LQNSADGIVIKQIMLLKIKRWVTAVSWHGRDFQ